MMALPISTSNHLNVELQKTRQ